MTSLIMTAGDMTWLDAALLIMVALMTMLAVSVVSRICRIAMLLLKRSTLENRLAEIDAMIRDMRITTCDLDVLPDGTYLLYRRKDKIFLAQGQGIDQLRYHLLQRYGPRQHFLWADGGIET